MAKEWARPFYRSKAWQQCRIAYIASVYGLCETCAEKGIDKPGKILHHTILLTPFNINDPDVTLNWNYLRYECKECHDKNEGHGVAVRVEATRDGLMFDDSGQLVEINNVNG
ncbi:MAG: HNH endonuclease [Bacillota bacterium]|nr:HNH endonuclease [Bacillota bacterium]